MGKIKQIVSLLFCCVFVLALVACGSSTDFKNDVQGTWSLYHYYENAENGVDVFLDDSNYWTVTVSEDEFWITTEDESELSITGGTFEWTKADEAEVVYSDGTRCTMRISANSKKYNELGAWDIYVVETNMYYVLEIPEGEE